jgi:hypothetical protein
MGARGQALLLLAGSCLLLFAAFKLRFIGGGGAGADRDKNPINFWLGVGTTAFIAVVALIVLISTFVR